MRQSCALALSVVACLAVACSTADEDRDGGVRNVVLLTVDALRADHLGTYGYERPTSPHIDALADEGWLFESAYTVYPRTGPSVASLLTGMFPSEAWAIPEEAWTLAEVLSESGRATVAAVDNANLSSESGYAQGFDVYRETWEESDSEVERTRLMTETALEWVPRLVEEGRPFFLWLHYVNPHTPYTPPSPHDGRFVGDDLFEANQVVLERSYSFVNGIRPDTYVEGQHRAAWYVAQYDAEIAFADEHIGTVLEMLRSLPTWEETLVVVTSDHGESLGENSRYFKHGPLLTEPNVRVPLIFRIGGRSDGRRYDPPVSLPDVMPTILDLAALEWPGPEPERTPFPLAGRSLVPVLEGTVAAPYPYLFLKSRRYWAVRSGDLKLMVKTGDDEQLRVPGEPVQLYDLAADPAESRNLLGEEGLEGRSERLLALLDRRRELRDSLPVDAAKRFSKFTEKALENLRALGYVR